MDRPTIAIVGAGFSGTLLALHILRRCPPHVRLMLIERNRSFGRGHAYATGNPGHLLNVPAGRMSAIHDQPSHFLDWLVRTHEGDETETPHTGSFTPRQRFGNYVRSLLNEELKRPENDDRLTLVRGDVQAIATSGSRLCLQLDRERQLRADLAVLAIGNFPPEPPSVADMSFYDSPYYRPDPWASEALSGIDPAARILLIGTGLTMVDAVVSLLDADHMGPIHALSRRGLLPLAHASSAATPPEHGPFPTRLVSLLHFMRSEVARVEAVGGDWRPIVDELRPFTQDVWQAMSVEDRRRFLRHLRPWWDVHRHRCPPEVAKRMDAARARGQLHVHAGRVQRYDVRREEVEVTFRTRGTGEPHRLSVQRVVNCSGPCCDFDRIADPLVRALLRDRLVRPDPLRLGLDVTATGALFGQDGAISRRLFAIGPVTRGAFWEITAVPDIRRQAELLAAHLATLVGRVPVPATA